MEGNHYLNFNKKTARKVIEQRDNYIKKNGKFYTLDGEDISDLYTEEIRPIYTSEKQKKGIPFERNTRTT